MERHLRLVKPQESDLKKRGFREDEIPDFVEHKGTLDRLVEKLRAEPLAPVIPLFRNGGEPNGTKPPAA